MIPVILSVKTYKFKILLVRIFTQRERFFNISCTHHLSQLITTWYTHTIPVGWYMDFWFFKNQNHHFELFNIIYYYYFQGSNNYFLNVKFPKTHNSTRLNEIVDSSLFLKSNSQFLNKTNNWTVRLRMNWYILCSELVCHFILLHTNHYFHIVHKQTYSTNHENLYQVWVILIIFIKLLFMVVLEFQNWYLTGSLFPTCTL